MQKFFRTAVMLERLSERLILNFRDDLLISTRRSRAISIGEGFQVRRRLLEPADEQVFERDPLALLRVFLLVNSHPLIDGFAATTVRLIRENRHLNRRRVSGAI